ncbi:hypothetical protein CBG53_00820 [Porphyromonas gingivalis]|uniref:Uncharacterized protein n=1 Tax=Porphyromonas phage phage023a_KCOM2797 TaxID=3154113 RepID=A0AAT9JKV6_9CAUD|nr:hypothetical protein [Porphyromonas gingivalis]OWP34477.1 hypothetical protein CBG53_00820 [Porphyromonas gingivalis]
METQKNLNPCAQQVLRDSLTPSPDAVVAHRRLTALRVSILEWMECKTVELFPDSKKVRCKIQHSPSAHRTTYRVSLRSAGIYLVCSGASLTELLACMKSMAARHYREHAIR